MPTEDRKCRAAEDETKPRPLADFDARLRAAREAGRTEPARLSGSAVSPTLTGMAMRAGVELFAGVAVGVAVGYGLDLWLETSPIMLILCFVLGAAAGMLNVYRAISGLGMALGYRRNDDDGTPGSGRG